MTHEELNWKSIIEQVETKRISQKKEAEMVEISERHFRWLINWYRKTVAKRLVSDNRGKSNNHSTKVTKSHQFEAFIADQVFEDIVRHC